MAQKPGPNPASNEKNEYIPSFITQKPFYVPDDDSGTSQDYLEHQRLQKEEQQSKWYDRGKRKGPAATKYRKGACENCGSMTHKTKECLSRPRAKGAKWSGKNIEADDVVDDVRLGWDAKRDRWNGYDPSEYLEVVKDFEEMEKLKRKARGENEADGDVGKLQEARYTEESDMGRQQSTATRNLRLREDTAKYLLNLDPESATYDPKTRTMVNAGATADATAAMVAEDNFERSSGLAAEFEKAQRFAWESQGRGDANKIHLQANPTSGEFIQKKLREENAKKHEAQQKHLLNMYGGSGQQKSNPLKDAAVTESEKYVEYDANGVVKGLSATSGKSKYPEDIFLHNHTSVWGSWWKDFQWGYACCHSTVKNSYCTGEAGRGANNKAEEMNLEGEQDVADAQENKDGVDARLSKPAAPSRKRTAEEIKTGVTEEDMEAYKRSKIRADDPMAKFVGSDELVH